MRLTQKWDPQKRSTKLRLTKHKEDLKNEAHKHYPQKWDSQKISTKMKLTKNTKLRLTKMFHKNVTHKIDPQKQAGAVSESSSSWGGFERNKEQGV